MNFQNKKSPIRFDGTKEIETRIKNQTDNVISRRFKILMVCVIGVGVIVLGQMFMTQISKQGYYETKLKQYNTDTITSDTFRGNIYDRQYKRLVYNKNINCATYYAVKGIKEDEIKVMVNFLIKNVNVDISTVTKRDKKDYLILKDKEFTDSLITTEEQKKYSQEDDGDQIIYNLKLQRITDDILNERLSDNDVKYYKLFYAISNCSNGSVVLLEGLSIKEASLIGENATLLRGIKVTNDWQREYVYDTTFKSVLGRVTTKKQGLPVNMKEALLASDYDNDSRVGVSGLEAQYENILKGEAATFKLTYDENGNPIINPVTSGTQGQNLRLTIDWDLQAALSEAIESELKSHTGYDNRYNNHIFVTMMNPNNGDILAMAGKERLESGEIIDFAAGNYLLAYEMGSTVKGGTIYNAYKNNIITPNTVYNDTSEGIKIAGTKAKKSHKALGLVNDVEALAQSSNVYMFHVAIQLGGGVYRYNESLTINPEAFNTLRNGYGELGLGVKTGLDVPTEELGYRGDQPLGGNLLDFAIGQYDTYTTIQLAQYVSTIANGGKRIQPHLFLESFTEDEDNNYVSLYQHQVKVLDDVSSYKTAFSQIQKGFRQCILTGTGKSVNGSYNPAGKTGTAQKFDSNNIDLPNHLFVGYAPYDNPEITVACMAERQKTSSGESCRPLAKLAFTKYFEKYGIKSQ